MIRSASAGGAPPPAASVAAGTGSRIRGAKPARPFSGAVWLQSARSARAALLHRLYDLYARRLWREIEAGGTPRHLAVILDGNRRYARAHGLPTLEHGYGAGAERVADVLRWSERAGIGVVTLWAMSLDNLLRPSEQVRPLVAVLTEAIAALARIALQRGWAIRGIGRRQMLPGTLSLALSNAESTTREGRRMIVQLAVGYGGHEEVVDALHLWAARAGVGGIPVERALAQLRPEDLRLHLYGADLPDPDLILRTSGELRLSGFLLWQSVYSEFYFSDVLWPELREVDFLRALRSYQARRRRFGR